MLEFRVSDECNAVRLDKFLRRMLPNVPASHLFKMIRVKKVKVNGRRAKAEQHLATGDTVAVFGDAQRLSSAEGTSGRRARRPASTSVTAADLERLVVLFEDDWLLAIDKPSGMAAHPGSGIHGGTVVDVVRAYLGPGAVRNEFQASPAHRLDRETSGVLLVAKRRPAMVHLTDVFTHHRAKKRYVALVRGHLAEPQGLIDLPLAEHQQSRASRERRGVNLQEARTRYRVLAEGDGCSLLECAIETGRTHQIRRHLAAIGHPVAGDAKHGDFPFNREARARFGLRRLFLHAAHLEVPHPSPEPAGRVLRLVAPLPNELVAVLASVGIDPARATARPTARASGPASAKTARRARGVDSPRRARKDDLTGPEGSGA